MKKSIVKSLVFCVLLGTVLSGCDDGGGGGGGGRPWITLSGTVAVILDGERPEKVDIAVYKNDTFSDNSLLTRAELKSYKTSGNNNWSVTIRSFSVPANLYIETRIFYPGTEIWSPSSYDGKHTQITDVYQDSVSGIDLGNFNCISLTGSVGTVKADGVTMPRNDINVGTYRISDGKRVYHSRIFDDGNWYAMFEPFDQQESVKFHIRFGMADEYLDYEADTGKTAQVYNTKVSGIAIGDIEVTTKEINGTVTGENIFSVSALSSAITKEEYDNDLWQIKWLGQTIESDFYRTSWTMKLVSTAPQQLWFWVKDTQGNRYLTTSSIDTASAVSLDLAQMDKIIEAPAARLQSVLQAPLIRSVYSPASGTAASGALERGRWRKR